MSYALLFIFSMAISLVLRFYGERFFRLVPQLSFCDTETRTCYGKIGVFRVGFANLIFFGVQAVLMIGLTEARSWRGVLHNGCWLVKVLLWFCTLIAVFALPNSVVLIYAEAARFGAGMFIVVQLVLLLEFAYSWNQQWVQKDDTKWYVAIVGASVVMLLGSLAAIVAMYVLFTAAGARTCALNIAFITLTLLICILFTFLSLLDKIEHGALLPSSVIFTYCTYLCWSAISSVPSSDERWHCFVFDPDTASSQSWDMLVGIAFTLISVAYSTASSSVRSAEFKLGTTQPPPRSLPPLHSSRLADDDEDLDDPTFAYSPAFFHTTFLLASMYVAMLMCNWTFAAESGFALDKSWISVWIKIASQWLAAALYIWTLLAPYLFPDRDFGYS